MSIFNDLLQFFSAYPLWAKIVLVACVAVVLLILLAVPRTLSTVPPGPTTTSEASKPAETTTTKTEPAADRFILSIENVELFRTANLEDFQMDSSTEVKLRIDVNGVLFDYPSLEGVEWVRTGPSMAAQQFRLPASDRGYDIRIEGTVRENGVEARLVSLQTLHVDNTSQEGQYELYPVEMNTRAQVPSASVRYAVRPG